MVAGMQDISLRGRICAARRFLPWLTVAFGLAACGGDGGGGEQNPDPGVVDGAGQFPRAFALRTARRLRSQGDTRPTFATGLVFAPGVVAVTADPVAVAFEPAGSATFAAVSLPRLRSSQTATTAAATPTSIRILFTRK